MRPGTTMANKLVVLLLGGPGAGKGTQAERLHQSLGLIHISSGDLFRQIGDGNTAVAKLIAGLLASGDLVPDEPASEFIIEEIERQCVKHPGVVIDGFPRTQAQARQLDSWLAERGSQVAAVVHLKVDNETKITRAMHRGRPDDRREILDHRLDIYDGATRPVFDHYLAGKHLFDVDGERDMDTVADEILALIKRRRKEITGKKLEMRKTVNALEHA